VGKSKGPREEREAFVREVFASIAPVYDPMNRVLSLGFWERWQQRLIAILSPRPGEHWLDVACGTADLSLLIARRVGTTGRVEGIDLSPAMLAVGREKVARGGFGSTVVLKEGNALDLPYGDGTFDGAVVGFGLRNMADIPRAVAEMRRVVRPGGRVASLDVSHPEGALVRKGFHLYFDGIVPLIGRLAGRGARPYAWLPESLKSFPDRRQLEEIFRTAGLEDVHSLPLMLGAAAIHWGRRPQPERG
jgi:demethylmenaquinone methyltransferase/2-methoxy-6-polyprenyl-1,4-benzoquinol methylase